MTNPTAKKELKKSKVDVKELMLLSGQKDATIEASRKAIEMKTKEVAELKKSLKPASLFRRMLEEGVAMDGVDAFVTEEYKELLEKYGKLKMAKDDEGAKKIDEQMSELLEAKEEVLAMIKKDT